MSKVDCAYWNEIEGRLIGILQNNGYEAKPYDDGIHVGEERVGIFILW